MEHLLEALKRPDLTFPITIDGEEVEIKFSYGLQQELLRFIPSIDKITDVIVTDPYLRDFVVRRTLTGNKRVTKDEDLIDPFDVDVSPDDIENMLVWVVDHLMYFFTTSATKAAGMTEKYADHLVELAAKIQNQTPSSQ